MYEERNTLKGVNYTRVTIAMARKLFYQGYPVKMIPSRMDFENPWIPLFNASIVEYRDFNKMVSDYMKFLCNATTGTYLKFHVRSNILDTLDILGKGESA